MSNTPNSLYPALLKAMREMGPIVKNATNPAFRSKYADLGAVIDAIEGPLWDNGLLIVQRFTQDGEGPILVTELIHADSGEKVMSAVRVVSKDPNDPQKVGGAITYYRRYSLLALLGLAPEDDDGHSAAKPAPKRNEPQHNYDDDPNYPPPPPRPQPQRTPAPAALPIDAVLAELDKLDAARTPFLAIKQYAHDNLGRFDPATQERIRQKVRDIGNGRKAVQPPASVAG